MTNKEEMLSKIWRAISEYLRQETDEDIGKLIIAVCDFEKS